jgi:hypothetical protein
VYTRAHADQVLLVALNFGGNERLIQLTDPRASRIVLSTGLDREGVIDLGHIVLRAHEGLVIELGSQDTRGRRQRLAVDHIDLTQV